MQPLKGITVVSLEHAIAAPFATRQLADLGARVIKIERPGVGDFARKYDERAKGLSSHFVWTNRSKESLTLDLKDAQALSLLKQLIHKEADVVVQNLAPGAAQRMGLSFEALSKKKPGIIVCDISGYGSDGPFAKKKAYDLLIQSEAGFLSTTGPENEIAKAGISIADISAGMYAYTNILAALMHRQQTGEGQRIDIAMLETLAEWMSFPLYYSMDGANPPPRAGASHASIYPYGPFEAGDGKVVMLGLQNEREWLVFCEKVMRQAELADDERFNTNPKRSERREELKSLIVKAFSTQTAAQVAARLEEAGIANAQVNTMADVWAHEQLKARGRWSQVQTTVGEMPALVPPGSWERGAARMDAVPAIGEHTDLILKGLGCTASDIEQMRLRNAI
jgi:crotonobetainyl-CoA:carnitine CoA-transferase CaiB-like acyl-CoA transferase